jgi:hypothetical protein
MARDCTLVARRSEIAQLGSITKKLKARKNRTLAKTARMGDPTFEG